MELIQRYASDALQDEESETKEMTAVWQTSTFPFCYFFPYLHSSSFKSVSVNNILKDLLNKLNIGFVRKELQDCNTVHITLWNVIQFDVIVRVMPRKRKSFCVNDVWKLYKNRLDLCDMNNVEFAFCKKRQECIWSLQNALTWNLSLIVFVGLLEFHYELFTGQDYTDMHLFRLQPEFHLFSHRRKKELWSQISVPTTDGKAILFHHRLRLHSQFCISVEVSFQ